MYARVFHVLVHGDIFKNRLGLLQLTESDQNIQVLHGNWQQLCSLILGRKIF
jgi:hypothetical protein